jgi:hypothetical protein
MSRTLSIVTATAAVITVLLMCWMVWRMEQVTSYVVTEPANGTGEHWKASDPGGAWEVSVERRRGEQASEFDARVRFLVDLATAEARERGSR